MISKRDEILEVSKRLHVDAIIPGYGFLSEDAAFTQKVADAGMIFVGPSSQSMTEMGQKHRARELAVSSDVPVVPGTELLESEDEALDAAKRLGFPVRPLIIIIGRNLMISRLCSKPQVGEAAWVSKCV